MDNDPRKTIGPWKNAINRRIQKNNPTVIPGRQIVDTKPPVVTRPGKMVR